MHSAPCAGLNLHNRRFVPVSSKSSPMLLRSKDLKKLLPEKIFLRAWKAGWITPALQRPAFTLWPDDSAQVVKRRLMAGEYPPPLPCELPKKEGVSHAA